jgi:hypothetical protein
MPFSLAKWQGALFVVCALYALWTCFTVSSLGIWGGCEDSLGRGLLSKSF